MVSILRLSNGSDLHVKLSVAETIATLHAATSDGFVELPAEEGSVHVRPSGVIAVIGQPDRKTTGFRFAELASPSERAER